MLRQELSEVEDGRLVVGEERLEPVRVPLVGQPLVRVARVRRIGSALGDQVAQGLVARERHELVDVDARRDDVHAVDVTDDLVEHAADVLRADEDRLGLASDSLPHLDSSSFPRIEYSSSEPCALTAYAGPGRRRHGPAEHDVVREHEVGRQMHRSAPAFAVT